MTEQIILSDGRAMAYEEYGDKKGKPLLFFHGWPGSRLRSGFYDKIAKKLKIRIISPDRPGYGLSDYQENRTLLDYPDDIIELSDKLKIKKFAVVGVSGGGPYAAVCAYKIPERLTKAGIVVGAAPMYKHGLLKGMPWIYKFGWEIYPRFPFVAYLAAFSQLVQVRYFPNLLEVKFRAKADKPVIRKYQTEFNKITKEAFRQGIKGAAGDLILYTSDWGFDLRKIKAKVYLWYGEDDKNVPLVQGKYLAKQIPKGRLTIYPNEGHLISITHAEEIFETLA